jgi:hypothetical protein
VGVGLLGASGARVWVLLAGLGVGSRVAFSGWSFRVGGAWLFATPSPRAPDCPILARHVQRFHQFCRAPLPAFSAIVS